MKYYKIDIKISFKEQERIASSAEGEKIPNAEDYFYLMDKGEEISFPPLFDYFYLKSFDQKEFWEWRLDDVYDFIGEGSQIPGWLISERLKNVFERYNLVNPYYMYNSKLLFKKEKLDYFIFVFRDEQVYTSILSKINFEESIFIDSLTKDQVFVSDVTQFDSVYNAIYMKNRDIDSLIRNKRLVLKKDIDFFPMYGFLYDNIVSERLKKAIEQEGITGFEFTELDYEVIIDSK